MDTLCIPVDPHPTVKALRKKAIQLLGRTFHEARAVLILDRELEIVNSSTASFLELGTRLLCSGWMKRLWTLQEATLASEALGEDRLFFQMGDGPFPYRKYDPDRPASIAYNKLTTELAAEEHDLLNEHGVLLLLGEQLPSLRGMHNMRDHWAPFRMLFTALEHRTTSKAEDTPLCVTSLLGKDVSSILSGSGLEQRMANFYVLMREIPAGFLWVERAKKIATAPFRWAPVSITDCPESTFMGWPNVTCDAAGLHVRYAGFILKELVSNTVHEVLPHRFVLVSADSGKTLGRLQPSSESHASKNPVRLKPGLKLAIMVRRPPPPVLPTPDAAIVVLDLPFGQPAAQDGVSETEIVCTVVGYRLFNFFEGGDSPDPKTQTYIRCDPTPENQMWCIT